MPKFFAKIQSSPDISGAIYIKRHNSLRILMFPVIPGLTPYQVRGRLRNPGFPVKTGIQFLLYSSLLSQGWCLDSCFRRNDDLYAIIYDVTYRTLTGKYYLMASIPEFLGNLKRVAYVREGVGIRQRQKVFDFYVAPHDRDYISHPAPLSRQRTRFFRSP